MQKNEYVVLVDENGNETGTMEKIEAHEKGVLHKAISIIIFNSKGEILLQQRAAEKYHWPEIWSNSVCSHPRLNETFLEAAKRRLHEELGFSTSLTEAFTFTYKATDEVSGLTEHEFDTVFIGTYDGAIEPNAQEVMSIRWITKSQLTEEIQKQPERFSFWFKIILKEMQQRDLL